METIDVINRIEADRKKAKEIACRVQKKREQGEDNRTFADVLKEELDRLKNKKATKNPDQSVQRSSMDY